MNLYLKNQMLLIFVDFTKSTFKNIFDTNEKFHEKITL